AGRPPLPDPDGLGKAPEVANPRAAVQEVGPESGKAEEPGPGEGAGIPGRQAAGGDKQRGGAGKPALPQGPEEHLQRQNESARGPAPGIGHAPGTARPRARTDRESAPSCSLQAQVTTLTLLQCPFFAFFIPFLGTPAAPGQAGSASIINSASIDQRSPALARTISWWILRSGISRPVPIAC